MPSLIEYHISRLRDKNPEVRARSARELGLIGDPVALPVLEQVYRTETDVEVKIAIQEAGRAIYRRQVKDENGG